MHIEQRSGVCGETADSLDHLEKPVYGGPDHAVTGLDADTLDLASAAGPVDSTYGSHCTLSLRQQVQTCNSQAR